MLMVCDLDACALGNDQGHQIAISYHLALANDLEPKSCRAQWIYYL